MILVYHHVCPLEKIPARRFPQEGWNYTITPAALERQLNRLRERGFRFVDFDRYLSFTEQRQLLVTFDDGWRDTFDYALPILERLQIPATFFLITSGMPGVPTDRHMSPTQIRQLLRSGMTVGAHTQSHQTLDAIPLEAAKKEIVGSKTRLEEWTNEPVRYFAYPFGRFNRRLIETVREAGFQAACGARGWGSNSESCRYRLHRDMLSPHRFSIMNRLRTSSWFRYVVQFTSNQDRVHNQPLKKSSLELPHPRPARPVSPGRELESPSPLLTLEPTDDRSVS